MSIEIIGCNDDTNGDLLPKIVINTAPEFMREYFPEIAQTQYQTVIWMRNVKNKQNFKKVYRVARRINQGEKVSIDIARQFEQLSLSKDGFVMFEKTDQWVYEVGVAHLFSHEAEAA
jgi:hypothetical protein